jgi:hypothetical protein
MQDFAPILTVAVKDNGDYDLDETLNSVLDPRSLHLSASSSSAAGSGGNDGYEAAGGCDAGLGLAAIGVLIAIAAVRRRKRG